MRQEQADRFLAARAFAVANFASCQFSANFGEMLLVFGCIGTDFCKKIRVFQFFRIFQNLPDYQAEIFEIWQNLRHLQIFC